MSRLGLLAVAFSSGKVLLYSLPHAEDLNAYRRTQVTGRNGCKKWEEDRQVPALLDVVCSGCLTQTGKEGHC